MHTVSLLRHSDCHQRYSRPSTNESKQSDLEVKNLLHLLQAETVQYLHSANLLVRL